MVDDAAKKVSAGADAPAQAEIDAVLEKATATFGDRTRAAGWMSVYSPILDAVPNDLLCSQQGLRALRAELGRIHWGDCA